jgi:hypothetical protein
MRWIHYLRPDIQVIRLHAKYLSDGNICHDINLDKIEIQTDNGSFGTDEIGVVWTRKWSQSAQIATKDKLLKKQIADIKHNIEDEFDQWHTYFLYLLEQNKRIYWLNHPQYAMPNKLIQLKKAMQAGLKVPQSYISNNYSHHIKDKLLITKPLTNCISFQYSDKIYSNYTSRVSAKSDTYNMFISYFQEEVKKLLELRVFYLAGQCYAIAIHSQGNSQTEVDYRRYDFQHANRNEYYQLPDLLEQKINIFMQNMNLQTGSLDFILTPNGDYVFLEVNPSGQYDIFNLCNIYPDKLIAEHLISKL